MVLSAIIFYQSIEENVVVIGLPKLLQVFKVHYSVAQVCIRFCSWCAHETKIIVHILAHVVMSVDDWRIQSSIWNGVIQSDPGQ